LLKPNSPKQKGVRTTVEEEVALLQFDVAAEHRLLGAAEDLNAPGLNVDRRLGDRP
jgi:hypothetical protein